MIPHSKAGADENRIGAISQPPPVEDDSGTGAFVRRRRYHEEVPVRSLGPLPARPAASLRVISETSVRGSHSSTSGRADTLPLSVGISPVMDASSFQPSEESSRSKYASRCVFDN